MSRSTNRPQRSSTLASAGRNWTPSPQNIILLLAVALRVCIGRLPHSGMRRPPMYGDFEAQRHWMELTVALPLSDWYKNTTDNDLQYWGLDYPPLTAYHSWLCGMTGSIAVPEMFELHTSRGHESAAGKFFMRLTVLVADLFTYLPACCLLVKALQARTSLTLNGARCLIWSFLFHPGLIIVDHGHFQYNGVSIGLAFFAIALIVKQRILLGSVFFCLALNYKQMLLYYSPAFFFYILSKEFVHNPSKIKGIFRILIVGITVICTFAVIWSPWIFLGKDSTLGVLQRLFPFNRGLFEDKVANFWCTLSLVYKAHLRHPRELLVKCSTAFTVLGFMPASIHTLRYPSVASFLFSITNTALAFYLFSFQVHEKTILVPLMPACALVALLGEKQTWAQQCLLFCVGQFNLVAMFSIYPLVVKDALVWPYMSLMVATTIFWYLFILKGLSGKLKRLGGLSTLGMMAIHIVHAVYEPPARYPDLVVMMFTTYSFLHFAAFWVGFNILQWAYPTKQSIPSKRE